MQASVNMREVRAALLMRGWRSVTEWANHRGFVAITVRRAIYNWWHRSDREPLGGINRQIIAALRAELKKPEQRRTA